MRRKAVKCAAAFLLIGVMGGSAAAIASASDSQPKLRIVKLEPVEVPIIDDATVPGTLRVDLAVAIAQEDGETLVEERKAVLREAQVLALMEFARLRADPNRAVNVDRMAIALDDAAKAAGLSSTRTLIQSVRAEAA